MYPNPQDVLPLPPRPDPGQYRTRAKELVAAGRAGEPAVRAWAAEWIDALARLEPSFARTPARERDRRAHQVAAFAWARLSASGFALAQAQFVIARAHGFEGWPRLVHHVEGLAADTGVAAFERAAEAVVGGELAALQRLLAADPSLVRARSGREHRATLLHYVSANGIENHRQRTPANIVEIAGCLLDAGAEVDAEADVYGGGATALGLVATSGHPRRAGLQIPLIDLLVARGARLAPDAVHASLVNGCGEAAAHLASLGAPVGVVEAAGIGRLEVLRAALEPPRSVPATEQGAALVMAAWYDQREAAALLLELGVPADARGGFEQQTALHSAAFQGNAPMVELLLRHGAPLDVVDATYGTTPFVWALHAWLVEERGPAEAYATVLRTLAAAGATVRLEWLDDDRLRGDVALHRALRRAAGG